MRFFFYHFYHTFAWAYDFVAALVSIGRWNDWIKVSLPFVQGVRILEIGYGTGQLQAALREASPSLGPDPKRLIVGIDESTQMANLAKRRLRNIGFDQFNLTRGLAQSLPFPAQTFDTVVSTFPSEYIFDSRTLSDVMRILDAGGRFIVLPAAWIVGQKIRDRLASWLFRVTGETPRNLRKTIANRAVVPLRSAGFDVEVQELELRSSLVMIIVATK
ncbi:MAG: class I SAM-dependent methyltransferase [Chloroflexi bacterium]|nr:class I SAM-dependent methyltransferase [Chloroflexota bacterium]